MKIIIEKTIPRLTVATEIAKTGALCCVATGPQGTKVSTGSRDYSSTRGEPHWRTNSSFSPPPPSRRWDCRFQSDGLPQESNGPPLFSTSLSSNGKRSRSRVSSDQYADHHQHSLSDGVVSYSGSPSDNFQGSRWTLRQPKYSCQEFPTPSVAGSRSEASPYPFSLERRFTGGASAAPNSFRSPSSLSESSPWDSTSKQPESLPHSTFSSRRSFLSKPVYPLVYQNPVSDGEAFGSAEISCVNRLATPETRNSSHWPSSSSPSLEHKFQKTLNELQRMDASPDHSMSPRREGFRWSNASSYDLGFDGESFDVAEHVELENPRSPNYTAHQKCVLCGRLLSQKSPWSSYCMVRGGDMPIAGVLSCNHVFHAECLEQATPKAQVSEPPCPVCLKTVGVIEESESFSEPLQMALRTIRRNRGVVISDGLENTESDRSLRRNRSSAGSKQNGSSSSLIKNHLKKHLSFKGKSGKDFFGTKNIFRKIGSSSSSQGPADCAKSWKKVAL